MSVREFFLNLAANVAAAALSPADMIGYLIALAFVLVWLGSWHRKRIAGRKRGVDSWYFIAFAFIVAVVAIGGAAYGIGLRSAPHSVDPKNPELQSQLEAAQKELAAARKITAPAPAQMPGALPASASDVIGGPYQPEELRIMILALGSMGDVLNKQIYPAYTSVREALEVVPINLRDNGYDGFSKKTQQLEFELRTARGNLHKIVFEENASFSEELRTPINDPSDALNLVQRGLLEFSNDLEDLGKLGLDTSLDGASPGQRLALRSAKRIDYSIFMLTNWVTSARSRVGEKQKNLRELTRSK
jgi:hypothetical protein